MSNIRRSTAPTSWRHLTRGSSVLGRATSRRPAWSGRSCARRRCARMDGIDAFVLPATRDRGAAHRGGRSRCASRRPGSRGLSTRPGQPVVTLPAPVPRLARRHSGRRAHQRGALRGRLAGREWRNARRREVQGPLPLVFSRHAAAYQQPARGVHGQGRVRSAACAPSSWSMPRRGCRVLTWLADRAR